MGGIQKFLIITNFFKDFLNVIANGFFALLLL